METKYLYLIIGIAIGWITKLPFLIKWYNELKKTKDYQNMKDEVHFKEMAEKYKILINK